MYPFHKLFKFKMMHAALSVLLFPFFISAASATGLNSSREINKTVPLQSKGRLTIKAYKGTIKINTWDRPEVKINAIIEAAEGTGSNYARRSVEATEVVISGSERAVTIRSDYDAVPSRRSWLFSSSRILPYVHYTITAPENMRLEIDDYKSKIDLQNIEGHIALETYKGTLDAKNLRASVTLETYKGEVYMTDLDGSINVNTYKGNVKIYNARLDENSRFETYKGLIALSLPGTMPFHFRADLGRRADFHSDFLMPEKRRKPRKGEAYISTDINGGGPEIYFKSSKGTMKLKND